VVQWHLEIAIGISEGGNRTLADTLIDADRFAGAVINETDLREAEQYWDALPHLKAGLDARPNNLIRWNAINLLRPRRMNSTPPPEMINVLTVRAQVS